MAAENVGTIYYEVDADTSKLMNSVGPADKSLDGLNQTFKKTDKAANDANFKLTKTAAAVKSVGAEAKMASLEVRAFSLVLAAVLAAQRAAAIVEMADSYNEMAERIAMATSSAEEYRKVQGRLLDNANETYRSLSEAQSLYVLTASTLKSLGYNTDQTLDIVDSLSFEFVKNATEADRAAAAIDAFTKSINKGKVDSDAWQTILAAVPSIVDDIAKSTGMTTAAVLNLGAQGKLTGQMLTTTLLKTLKENKLATDQMTTTVSDSFRALKNNLSVVVGETNRATGMTSALSSAIADVAEAVRTVDLTELERQIVTIEEAVKQFSQFGDGWLKPFMVSTDDFSSYMPTSLGEAFTNTAQELDGLSRFFTGTWGGIQASVGTLTDNVENYFSNMFDRVLNTASDFVNNLSAALSNVSEMFGGKRLGMVAFGGEGNRPIKNIFDSFSEGYDKAAKSLGLANDLMVGVDTRMAEIANGGIHVTQSAKSAADAVGGLGNAAAGTKGKLSEAARAAQQNAKVIDQLREAVAQAALTGQALAEAKAAARLNKFATPEDVAQVKALADALYQADQLKKDKQILQQVDPITGEETRYQTELANLQKLNDAKLIEDQRYLDLKAQATTAHEAKMQALQEANFRQQSTWNDMLIGGIDQFGQAATNALAGLATGASSGTDAVRALAQAILQEGIGSLVKMGVQYVKNLIIGQSAQAALTAAGVAQASVLAAAWAPAAALASLASFGANAAPAVAGISTTMAAAQGLALLGARQYGGPVDAGGMYRINETGKPEILNTAGGQQYLLPNQRGQVVSNKDATSAGSGVSVSVNLIEDASRGGQVEQTSNDNGEVAINAYVADIRGGGKASRTLEATYGLKRKGR